MKISHYHFIINPRAKGDTAIQRFDEIRRRHLDRNISYDLHVPHSPLAAIQLSQRLSQADTALVAIGGDGTINAVATGLAQSETPGILGILPLGTGNALSYTLGVRRLSNAIEALLCGYIFPMDLIKTNSPTLPFVTFMAGIGIDSKILKTRRDTLKWGHFFSFPMAVLKNIRLTASSMKITVDGQPVTGIDKIGTVLINNGHCYGFGLKSVPEAYLDDGLMEIQLFPNKSRQLLSVIGYNLGMTHFPTAVPHYRGRRVSISGERFGQIDGDVILQDEFRFEVAPDMIRVIAADTAHFSQPPLGQLGLED